MSMSATKMRLTSLTKELLLKWDQTKDCWQDTKSQEFEGKYLDELVSGGDKAASVIDQLDRLVTKVRSDCE